MHTTGKCAPEDQAFKAIMHAGKRFRYIVCIVNGVTSRLPFAYCAPYCYYNRKGSGLGARKFCIFEIFLRSK